MSGFPKLPILRIGVVVHGFLPMDWAGVPLYIDRLCKGLVELGDVEMHCIVAGSKLTSTKVERNGYTIHYIPMPKFPIGFLKPIIFFALSLILVGSGIVRRRRLNIIHGHTTLYGGFQSLILGAITQVPVILTLHGADRLGPMGFILNRADLIVVQRTEMYERMLKYGIPKWKVRLVPNCIETGWGPSSVHSDTQPRVAFVARLDHIKRPDLFIRALEVVRREIPQVHAVVMGEGALMQECVHLVESLGLESTVSFTGYVANPFIGHLGSGDIFVACSDIENFSSTSLLEAMEAGMAVIATDVGETHLAIRDGLTGLLVAPSAESLGNAVIRLLADSECRKELGEAAQRLVRKAFPQSLLVKWHYDSYSRITGPNLDSEQCQYPVFPWNPGTLDSIYRSIAKHSD